MTPKDYYRAAHILIRQFGDAAEEEALARMKRFTEAQDVVAASAWLMIAQCIGELSHPEPLTVH